MTTEQRYHRRLARKEVMESLPWSIQWCLRNNEPDYRGVGSPYLLAKSAAWHAFKAHPELREPDILRRTVNANLANRIAKLESDVARDEREK